MMRLSSLGAATIWSSSCPAVSISSKKNLVMEKVIIMKRGEPVGEMIVVDTGRIGSNFSTMVPYQFKIVDLRSLAPGRPVYVGSAFAVSLFFSKNKQISFDDSATQDFRRLIQLEF